MTSDKNIGSSKIKLSNKNSAIAQEKQNQEQFEQQANQVNSAKLEINNKVQKYSLQFLDLIQTKILAQNKDFRLKEAEKIFIKEFTSIIEEINNDPQIDSVSSGSTGLMALLLKVLLYQRDRINLLDYQLTNLLEKIIDKNIK